MPALDLIFMIAGMAAAAVVAVGCVICLVVWIAGGRKGRASEVCPPARKS